MNVGMIMWKRNTEKKGKLWYMDADSFVVQREKRCLNKIVRLFANDNKIIKLIDKRIIKKILRYCLVMVIK